MSSSAPRWQLAAVSHDSAPRSERPGKNKAQRGQKIATEGGQRPGVLQDPKPQVAVDRAGLLLECWVPSLAVPRFDDDDGPDNGAIAFFLARTAEHLFLKNEKRKELRRKEEEREDSCRCVPHCVTST